MKKLIMNKRFRDLIIKVRSKINGEKRFPPDFTSQEIDTIRFVTPYTKTSRERIHAMIQAVEYIQSKSIPGAIVECGVYRGGSMLAAAKTLLNYGECDRELYLLDTFEGMDQPTERDVTYKGLVAVDERHNRKKWSYCSLDEVKHVMALVPYDESKIHYVEGKVEDTVPDQAPDQIALLRLDTDWYESTKHELEELYPRVVSGGLIIVDDYGHWEGAKTAVDEYFDKIGDNVFLNRIDYTGRLIVKP